MIPSQEGLAKEKVGGGRNCQKHRQQIEVHDRYSLQMKEIGEDRDQSLPNLKIIHRHSAQTGYAKAAVIGIQPGSLLKKGSIADVEGIISIRSIKEDDQKDHEKGDPYPKTMSGRQLSQGEGLGKLGKRYPVQPRNHEQKVDDRHQQAKGDPGKGKSHHPEGQKLRQTQKEDEAHRQAGNPWAGRKRPPHNVKAE